MAYVDAITNAIGARGNALAQGEMQRGQVWGNLAANLGQIPQQAMLFDQQRQSALQNNELKKIALEKAQRNAEMDKEAVRIVHSGAPDEQILMELERVYSGDPERFQAIQNLKSKHLMRQQQMQHQQRMEESQTLRDQIAFHGAQAGGPGVPTSMPTPTGPDLSGGNALSPLIMAQPNIPMQSVNPPLTTKFGTLPGAPTREEQNVQKRQTAAEELAGKKDLASFQAGLKTNNARDYLTSQVVPDRKSPTGYRYMQWNPDTNAFDRPGNEAPPPMSTVAQLGMGQFAGTQGGQAVIYKPTKGGTGKLETLPLPGEGPLRPKTTSTGEVKETSGIEASEQKIVNLKTMYNKDWVGPAQGRWNDWMMAVPGVKVDPKMAKFYAANTALENEVIKFITGAQMSEPESKRILRQVPTFRDKSEVWEAKYDQTLENVRIMKEKMRAAGYVFGESESPKPSAPTGGRSGGGRRMSDKSDAELKKILGIK